jgi:hypothetical protein
MDPIALSTSIASQYADSQIEQIEATAQVGLLKKVLQTEQEMFSTLLEALPPPPSPNGNGSRVNYYA